MIHKNWQELIRPTALDIRPGADTLRTAKAVAEPL
ncbi:MAG: DNA-directed RNA polymerase subunit alpha, partial [Pseudomonadota bacterium]